ncbi:MAG: metallopeptidase family protein [Parvularculaceae bacterium]|nr:metallopeptidase family protein [Parvularculaceae bacterium]
MTLAHSRAPSIDDIERIAAAAFALLPAEFRALCDNLVIHVEDFAPDDVLESLGLADAFELTGLYEGVDVTAKSLADPAAGPDHVFLYRRPLLDEWADNGEITLEELVRHVLVHEIGHHFGFSDEAMHDIEARAG